MADNAPTDAHFSLRVRNLPAVLSTEAITSLLSHYGATRVRVLQRRNAASSGKEPGAATAKRVQKALATFATREVQQNAQRRLHSLELAGQHLQVEVVGDQAATTPTEVKPETVEKENNLPLKGQPPLPKGLPPPLPPTPAPTQNLLYAPAPLAPHLGLNYAPSPLLEYKYPKATENIVRNIANALIALPRFYTQVLHLMNKMNLPPPFEESAIPGRFSLNQDSTQQNRESGDRRRRNLKRRRVDEAFSVQVVEEEDDADDSDGQDAVTSKNAPTFEIRAPPHQPSETSSKKDPLLEHKQHDELCREDNGSRTEFIGKPLVRQNRLSSIKKSAALNAVFRLGSDNGSYREVHRSTRPGVISENEVKKQRLSSDDLLKEPLMTSYIRGSPSTSIMVKNIALTVDEKDLRSVFGYVLPKDIALDSMNITLLPGKGSALITYAYEGTATAAVEELHGIQVEGKALIVSFQNASVSDTPEDISSAQRWSLLELASKRLPEAQLTSEKVMRKYQRGEPSNTLYVKNLSKTVELADLFAVFGAALPPKLALDTLKIRHFVVGRMKCQAFVTYPTIELASDALLHVHGAVLKDKPLIVCFRKPQTD